VAPDPITAEWEAVYTPVYPDLVVCHPNPQRPSEADILWHARPRETDDGIEWLWDELDVSNPEAPAYRIVRRARDGEVRDVTSLFRDETSWPEQWRDSLGRPRIPYVQYRAARTGDIYDPYHLRSMIEGTLDLAVLRTQLQHVTATSSWSQRWMSGLYPAGIDANTGTIIPDPCTVLLLQPMDDAHSPNVGQWEPPITPMDMWSVIEVYERSLIAQAGINPADLQRMSADPRSGLALSVSRDAQREQQRRIEPQFRAGDERTMAITAMQHNRATGSSLPEGRYQVTYHGVPRSGEELAQQRRHLLELVEGGMMSPVDAYRDLNPGLTDEQAVDALIRIREQRPALSTTRPAGETDGR